MYLISQISKITGLTKKALRYYDEQKILVPSYRDEENGYRLYTEDGEDISFILEEKIQYIENNIAREKALISSIRKELEPVIRENEKEKYSVQIEEIQACTVAGLRFKDAYNQVGKYVPELFKVVKGEANGNCFNLYYDEDYAEIADIEVCVPVKRMVSGEGVSSRKLPGIKAVCTVHYGNYENLRYAYKELFDYVNENNLKVISPSKEEYIKGPGMIFKGNPDKYITKIILPIEVLE